MPNQEPMIKVQDVRFRYDPEQPKYAVDGVSLDIRRGAVSYTHLTLPTIYSV